jgi:hypothetical protein
MERKTIITVGAKTGGDRVVLYQNYDAELKQLNYSVENDAPEGPHPNPDVETFDDVIPANKRWLDRYTKMLLLSEAEERGTNK